ncbi:DUF4325 domain-containing protein [Gilliamella sp. Fer1-1]|jgi:hypothetical protein|uniref:STAS-like domain-containing protein n=1 Tax=Gilliamella sp. Fer1-1 TaxID=3120240 RepID=UPI00080DCD91|nr:STAS-like domain-containing protein [Gilliamella apicola]OCG39337.1 DUF4325 domain-containing protein [Gilliamella apicola]
MNKILYVKDFSTFPGARYKRLGPASGEEFRDDVLIPALKQNSQILINFDGVVGYGSSFLEEVFGGLIRKGIDKNIVLNLVKTLISNDDALLKEEIQGYVNDAIKEKHMIGN